MSRNTSASRGGPMRARRSSICRSSSVSPVERRRERGCGGTVTPTTPLATSLRSSARWRGCTRGRAGRPRARRSRATTPPAAIPRSPRVRRSVSSSRSSRGPVEVDESAHAGSEAAPSSASCASRWCRRGERACAARPTASRTARGRGRGSMPTVTNRNTASGGSATRGRRGCRTLVAHAPGVSVTSSVCDHVVHVRVGTRPDPAGCRSRGQPRISAMRVDSS